MSTVLSCEPSPKNTVSSFYLGTYTSGESEGVYRYTIDEHGVFTNKGLAARIENPSYLAFSSDKNTLIAVAEVSKNNTGYVVALQRLNDSLILTSKLPTLGEHPCYVSIDQHQRVLVANYSGGNIASFKLQEGVLTPHDTLQHVGKGTTLRQDKAHAHYTSFFPSSDTLVSVDLGTNQLWLAKWTTQGLEPLPLQKITLPDEAGPRHLAFHPHQPWMYVLNELNNTVSVLKKGINGSWDFIQHVGTLPKDFTAFNTSAAIVVSSDGRFLYTSNRGHNSIAVFKITAETGQLTLIEHVATSGKTPRNFALTPNENFLVVANQDSNSLVSFKRNPDTGKLEYSHKIKAPSPVCIVFL